MYPPQQLQGDTTAFEDRSPGSDLNRDGFRPVALPALAAAVHVAASAAKRAARKAETPAGSSRFLHEDAPLV